MKTRSREAHVPRRGARKAHTSEAVPVYDPPIRAKKPKSMDDYLEELFVKKGSARENALASIIQCLSKKLEREFVEKKFATLLYRFLNCINKGSAKEIPLASHAIGLLTMTINSPENSHEIYEEAIPRLCDALKSKSKTSLILDCLAIVTFFGAENSEETERTMQIIWKFINPASGSDVTKSKHQAPVLTAAISAWSFLLTSMDGWRVHHKYWQGAISYFSDLLEDNDESICVAAGEALALVFETQSIDKFSREEDGCSDSPIQETSKFPENYSTRKQLIKNHVFKQIEQLCIKDDTNSSKICNVHWDVRKYFTDGSCLETNTMISGHDLTLTSWFQKIQLKFMRHFMGEKGFVRHMLENELLHNVFEFKPTRTKFSGKELYQSTSCEAVVRLVLPKERDSTYLIRAERKQERVLRNAIIYKAQTQLLNKQRKFSEMRKNDSYTIAC